MNHHRERSKSPSKSSWRESRLKVRRSLIRLSPKSKHQDGSFPTFETSSSAEVQAISSIEESTGNTSSVPSIEYNKSCANEKIIKSDSVTDFIPTDAAKEHQVTRSLAKKEDGEAHLARNHALEAKEVMPKEKVVMYPGSDTGQADAPAEIVIDKKEHRRSPPRPKHMANRGFLSKAIICGGKNPNVGDSVTKVQEEFERHRAQMAIASQEELAVERSSSVSESDDDDNEEEKTDQAVKGWSPAILLIIVILFIVFLASRGYNIDEQKNECLNVTSQHARPVPPILPMQHTRPEADSATIRNLTLAQYNINISSMCLEEKMSSQATLAVSSSLGNGSNASDTSESDSKFITRHETSESLKSNDTVTPEPPHPNNEVHPAPLPQTMNNTTGNRTEPLTVPQELKALITHFSPSTRSPLSANSASPQQMALEWLAANENIEDYPPWKRLQRFALATLYYSTNGNGWFLNDGWLMDSDECTWISRNLLSPNCDNEGRIVALFLDKNGLNRSIPEELFLLSSLRHLQLSGDAWNSSLSGTIPSQLFTLTNLVSLHLQSNRLEGSISSLLERMTALEILSLEKNSLTGIIPSQLGELTNLKALNIGSNALVGPVPSEFGRLTNLQEAKFRNNGLVGGIPSETGQLMMLETLWSSGNKHSRSIPTEIGLMTSLRDLRLNDNSLSHLPSEIGLLRSLTSLDVSRNSLKGVIPSELGALTNLAVTDRCRILASAGVDLPCETVYPFPIKRYSGGLRLHDNRLSGTIPSELLLLTDLQLLSLFGNKLSGSFECPESIRQCLISCDKAEEDCRVMRRGFLSMFG